MRALTLWFAAGAVVAPAVMPAQTRSRTEMVRAVDSLVIKGDGSADGDLEVPTPANAGYEIGSVTKQFTTGGGCGPTGLWTLPMTWSCEWCAMGRMAARVAKGNP